MAAAFLLAALLASCSAEITATRYALVYGAADYDEIANPDDTNDLRFTGGDAQAISAELSAAGWSVTVTRQPTVDKQQILDDIAALVPLVQGDSSVLVYFSGHGAAYSGMAYIAPTDAINDAGDPVEGNLISSSELLAALDALPCRNRVAVLDTCYSGGFVLATDTGTLDGAPQNFGEYDDGTEKLALFAALGSYGRLLAAAFESYDPRTPIVVTAAGAEELSYESSSYGHGVFTYHFLEAAYEGDTDGNGHVTIQEAYRYARKKVEDTWNDLYYYYYAVDGEGNVISYVDYLPRISGNARDVVIF